MASLSSSSAHRKIDAGSKSTFTVSNIILDTDDNGNIENNLIKLTSTDSSNARYQYPKIEENANVGNLDALLDESIFAYSIPSIHSTDKKHRHILTHSKEESSLSSSIHPSQYHDNTYFSLDGVEVESAISMSWRHEDGSSILGFSRTGSSSQRESSDSKTRPNTIRAESSSTNADRRDTDSRRCLCFPSYLRDAPIWIRSIVFTSVFLFIASFLLVLGTVSVRLMRDKARAIPYTRNNDFPGQSFPTILPSFSPMSKRYSGNDFILKTTTRPTKRMTSSMAPTFFTNQQKTMVPLSSRRPTSLPSLTRPFTLKPSSSSSFSPSSFWVMSQQYSNLTNMSSLLKSLTSSQSTVMALFHLGNWNDLASCTSDAYLRLARKYVGSPVPVIFIPGQNETNACPNPEVAMSYWRQYLLNYWPNASSPSLILDRDPSYTETFSIVYSGVLYIGVNVVGGIIINQTAWTLRLNQALRWIDDNANRFKNSVRLIVILGSSGPSTSNTNNDAFFSGLKNLVLKYNAEVVDIQSGRVRTLPFIYIHDSSSPTWGVAQKFMGVNRFIRVNVQGDKWPPLRVLIDPSNCTVMFD